MDENHAHTDIDDAATMGLNRFVLNVGGKSGSQPTRSGYG